MTEKSVISWWGETATKLVQSVAPALMLGAIFWAFAANQQLAVISTKLDIISNTLLKVENVPQRVQVLEIQEQHLQRSITECHESIKENSKRIDIVEKQIIENRNK